MRVRGWHVEGFGILADYTVTDLPPGLVLVHGANEAGKSTLLAFLRGVLFGYPSARTEPTYPPLRGGRHGGSVSIEGTDGLYRVERIAGRRSTAAIVRPDGSEGTETDLANLLGGADKQLFRSVFAFSLRELTSMAELSSDQVRAHIFSAGVAGAGRSARDIINRLVDEEGQLLGPRSGRVRELVKDAERLQADITRAQHRAADYQQALLREEEKSREVTSLRERLGRADSMTRRFRTLIDLWDTESQRQQKLEALAGLPEIDAFPPDPDTRLATALGNLDAASHAAAEAEAERAQLAGKRSSLHVDDRLAGVAATAERVAGESPMHNDRLARAADARRDAQLGQSALADALQRLGPKWTEERVTAFDTSLPAAEEVRAWQRRLRDTEEAARKALDEVAASGRLAAVIEDGLGRLGGALREGRDKPTEEWITATSARLMRVSEAIGQATGRAADLIGDPKPLAHAAETLADARRHRDVIRVALTRAHEELTGVAPQTGLDAHRDRVADAARHAEVEKQRLRDIAKLEDDRGQSDSLLERSIRDLGPGWSEASVEAVATDFGQLREIRAFSDKLERAATAVAAAARELDHVGKGRSAREKDLERLRAQLEMPEPAAKADLDVQARALRRLRLRLADLAAVESERKAEERAKTEAQADESGPARESASPRWALMVAAALAVLLTVAGTWRLLAHDTASGVVLLVTGVAVCGLALALRLSARATLPRDGALARRDRRLQELDRRIDTLEVRASALRSEAADEARVLGIHVTAALEEVEDRQDRWTADSEARRKRDELAAQAKDLDAEIESWRRSERVRRTEHEEALRAAAGVSSEWEAWLRERRLPTPMAADAARDFLDQVRSIQARIVQRDGLTQRLADERSAWEAWKAEASALLRAAGDRWAVPADERQVIDRLLELQRHCDEDAERTRQRGALAREIAECDSQLARAEQALEGVERAAADAVAVAVAHVEEEWRRGEPERQAATERLVSIVAESDRAKRQWGEWRAALGLEPSLSPEGVIDFFGDVAEARRAIGRRDTARAEAAGLQSAIDAWQAQVREALAGAGVTCPEGEPRAWVEAARHLSSRCRSDADTRQKAARLDEQIEATALKCRRLSECVKQRARELEALLVEAGVTSEGEFRSRLADYRRREKLQDEIVGLEARIVVALGRGEEADGIRAELATGRVGEWTAEQGRHAADAQALAGQHEAAIREHQDLVVARREVEEACDVADLGLQFQGVLADLQAAVHRRRVVSLAARLLRDTLGEYERLRQPQVLANAARSFSNVTRGRYPHITQTDGDDGIAVLDSAGRRHGLTDLSRGTQEQLYLSMRLGLAREFGQRAVALPLVMDDVLVNFDEARARLMAAELLAFAADNQVLLFTCHQFVRTLLVDLDPHVRVIDLPVHDIQGEGRALPPDQARGTIGRSAGV